MQCHSQQVKVKQTGYWSEGDVRVRGICLPSDIKTAQASGHSSLRLEQPPSCSHANRLLCTSMLVWSLLGQRLKLPC